MANRLPQPVGYRPFRVQPILQEGVLPSPRDDGELERKVAAGLARMADEFGQQADRQAVAAGQKAGEADAMAGAPGASTVTGDAVAPAQSGTRIAVAPENIRGVISEAATRHGVDPNALMQIASVESGFDPNAKNPNSSAGGLFQFIDGTAKQYGLADRFDPAQAADAAARLAKDNSAALKSALGRDPTAGELYLAHQQGAQGAIKLLSNPSARAADVVGGEAVSLNGGADGMTAGDFAAKWTSKFGSGSYKSIPSASSVAPVSVTPAAPVKIEPGKAGAFRPMEGDTLYARAYNVAGEKTYLQELKFTMLQDQDAVYDKYKDDPAMLQKAMGELYQAHVNEHVFPEIESDYRGWFQAGAYELQRKAQDAQQIRVKQQDLVDFQGRVQDLENNKSRVLAGMTFNDDTGSTQLAGLQAQIDDHYNAAVAKGMMTPQQAKQAREQSHAEMQVGYYSRQADGKSADEIASLRQTMQKDYSDNKLQGVSADEWELINKSLSAREREQRSQDHLAVTALSKRGNDIAARVMRGLPVDPAEYAKFQMDAASTPEGEQISRSTELKMRVADALRKQPIGEVESNLWPLMTAGGRAPTPDDYDAATKMVNSQKAELKQDPLGVAERFGIVPQGSKLPDPATASPDEMAEALNTRMVYADVAAQHFGVQPKYFRPEEEAVIKSAITSTDPSRNSSAMKQLDVFAARTGLLETEKTFGKDATDRLQDWQARVRYATPEEAQKWLTERNDPKWQERVKPLVTKGEAEARKLQSDDVVKLLNENGTLSLSVAGPADETTRRAMMNDFTTLMGERYAASGDADTAKKQAVERMQKVWGTTAVYGNTRGRLMLYPPEEHYPTVAGSGNWMREELAQVAQDRGFKPENMALVSDGKTKAAIERNEPPGYLLSKVNPDTGLEELVTDEKGRPLRHFFDVDAARKKALTQAEEARRTRNDPWLVFGNGTAIGPLYPGGADPADLADRQRRIQQIPAEQKQRLDTYEKTRQELPWAGIDTDIPGGQ
ncbi:transglycosylase SLT domain-containing protein [Agrobacterium vitis]|uniref:transglycosylase SLT domain-containing protein n=1 Tax=Agrobacterium vitis TaxID=373 RepID=UPI00307CD4FA